MNLREQFVGIFVVMICRVSEPTVHERSQRFERNGGFVTARARRHL